MNDPAFVNLWLGFFAVDVFAAPAAESPKFQLQEVGDPVEVSVNWSVSAVPEYLAVKEATGAVPPAGAFTETVFVVEELPAAFVAVRRTV
jgi:hypothetical protein